MDLELGPMEAPPISPQREQEEPQTAYQQELEHCQIAAVLLRAVWNGIDHDYLSKYRVTIWTQYEERVATCSRITNSLLSFLSKLSTIMQVTDIGKDDEERHFVTAILAGQYGNPDVILAALRRHPQVCVMLLRIQKDEEKQAKGYK